MLNPAKLVPYDLDYEAQMLMCFELIDKAKVVVFLDGWKHSNGSRREFFYALAKDYTRLYFETDGKLSKLSERGVLYFGN